MHEPEPLTQALAKKARGLLSLRLPARYMLAYSSTPEGLQRCEALYVQVQVHDVAMATTASGTGSLRQWFRFVHIGFFHVLIGANILLTRPDWFCLLDCHDKHRVLMGEPTIRTSLLSRWVLEILNRHYCLLQRGR